MVRVLFVLILGLSSVKAWSQQIGVGGVIGSPTGVSFSYDLGGQNALAAALAYNFSRYSGIHMHVDYLWTNQRVLQTGTWDWNLYYGLGGRLVDAKDDDQRKLFLGARVPVGFSHTLRDPNVTFFGEIAPDLNLVPRTDINIDIGIGARILF